jgi:hypothetical protein
MGALAGGFPGFLMGALTGVLEDGLTGALLSDLTGALAGALVALTSGLTGAFLRDSIGLFVGGWMIALAGASGAKRRPKVSVPPLVVGGTMECCDQTDLGAVPIKVRRRQSVAAARLRGPLDCGCTAAAGAILQWVLGWSLRMLVNSDC